MSVRDEPPPAGRGLDQTFVDQRRQRPARGHAADLEPLAEASFGGQLLPRHQPAGGDVLGDRVLDLLVQRDVLVRRIERKGNRGGHGCILRVVDAGVSRTGLMLVS